jgi:hypothetical protein
MVDANSDAASRPSSVSTGEGIGGVGALLHGLGTHPTLGLSTETGAPLTYLASPDPTSMSPTTICQSWTS